MMKRSAVLAALMFLALGFAAQSASAAPSQPTITVPIAGTFTDALGGVGTFAGNLNITDFNVVDDRLVAVGTVTGTLTNSVGAVIGTVLRTIVIPLTASGSCDILHLELGPLNLDLLGLVVDLNQVVLDIDAQTGSGNLLGNLLCAVTRLLDGGNLGAVANLLDQLLRILG